MVLFRRFTTASFNCWNLFTTQGSSLLLLWQGTSSWEGPCLVALAFRIKISMVLTGSCSDTNILSCIFLVGNAKTVWLSCQRYFFNYSHIYTHRESGRDFRCTSSFLSLLLVFVKTISSLNNHCICFMITTKKVIRGQSCGWPNLQLLGSYNHDG